MSAQTAGPDFEGVLRDHGATDYVRDGEDFGRPVCVCGERCPLTPSPAVDGTGWYAPDAWHRAHVAAALRAEVGRWLGSDPVAASAAQMGVYNAEADDPDPSVERYALSVLAALAECVGVEEVGA